MLTNTDERYGSVSKLLHWAVFLALVNQFAVAWAMTHTDEWETTAGFGRDALYEWHKTIGLVVLLLALLRVSWRKAKPLPDWAPNLSAAEKRAIHLIERLLYWCMFLMPISGFVFVQAGGYPITLFGVWEMPQFLPLMPRVSVIAQWTHAITAAILVATLLGHWGLGIGHQLRHRDRYFQRILPFTHQR